MSLSSSIEVQNMNGMDYLSTIPDKSIDLILTDPPYIISKDTGMNKHYNTVKQNEENNVGYVKTKKNGTFIKLKTIL